jgi:acyl-CoA synthetase
MKPLLTLHNPAVASKFYKDGYWTADTMYSLLSKHASERPSSWAVRDSDRRLSFDQLVAAVDMLAARMHRQGLVPGDRVCVWLPSCVESIIVFLACARNGYVCNPSLHQNYTVAEVVHNLERLRARFLFVKPGYGVDAKTNDIFSAAGKVEELHCIVTVGEERHKGNFGLRFEPSFDDDTGELPAYDSNPDKVVYLAFTSGTTGDPKGVMHSDNTLLANGRGMVADWELGLDDVLFTLSPLSHHIGTVALEQFLVSGCELVVNDLPSKQSPIDWISETGATYVMGVPTHAMDILSELRKRGANSLGKTRTFYMAGAPIPKSVAEAFLELGVRPQNVYGMTENGSHQYTRPGDDVSTIVSSCGKACPGFETAIWDAASPDIGLGSGEIGEIGTRGALLMLGYFDNQRSTEDSFNSSGWFLSGDLGWLDEQGCLHIVGRKKDLIIRGGHNIHPTHIESIAVRHPRAQSVAVIPVPDERLGEKVCLAVIPVSEQEIDPDDMLTFLHEQGLSRYDMPEYFVSLGDFPMTASGKILKRTLADWVREGELELVPIRWVGPVTQKDASNDS